jgi:hypothetical protein
MSKASLLKNRISIDPDAPARPVLRAAAPPAETEPTAAPVIEAVSPPEVEPETPSPAPAPEASRPEPSGRASKKGTLTDALADPEILAGRKGYRSFYVDDEAFARFRAAIYWSARNPAAMTSRTPVPLNMSAAIEEWMERTAGVLEKTYNGGEVFPMPPKTVRRQRSSK